MVIIVHHDTKDAVFRSSRPREGIKSENVALQRPALVGIRMEMDRVGLYWFVLLFRYQEKHRKVLFCVEIVSTSWNGSFRSANAPEQRL